MTTTNRQNAYSVTHVTQITTSLKQLADIAIVDFSLSPEQQAQQAYEADYVLLAHNGTSDPIFNYANKKGQELFEMDWDEFTQMHSKYSAESDQQDDRDKLLADVKEKGYSKDYSGIRISKTGRRFYIKDVLLWNVYNQAGERIGQAALFHKYEYI